MNRYEVVAIQPVKPDVLEPDYLSIPYGWAIYDNDKKRVTDMHLWSDPIEAQAHVEQQEEALIVQKHWPSIEDTEVQKKAKEIDDGFGEAEKWLLAMEAVARERAAIKFDLNPED